LATMDPLTGAEGVNGTTVIRHSPKPDHQRRIISPFCMFIADYAPLFGIAQYDPSTLLY